MNPYIYAGLNNNRRQRYLRLLEITKIENTNTTMDYILNSVSCCFKTAPEEIKSANRNHDLVKMRTLAINLIRVREPRLPLKAIGAYFNRDHSTIIYNLNLYNDLIGFNKPFQDMVEIYGLYMRNLMVVE